MSHPEIETAIPERGRPLADLFHENTKLNPVNDLDFAEGITDVSRDREIVRDFASAAKSYPGHRRFPLRSGFSERGPSVFRTLRGRRTRRDFSGEPLPVDTLAAVLWYSAAETGVMPAPTAPEIGHPLRASPSAGALHSIEAYPVLFSTAGVPAGAYHYNVPEHALELLRDGDLRDLVAPLLLAPEMTPRASGVLVLTAVLDRACLKYGERGYRFVHLDAGHLAQNVLLACEALNAAAVPLGGFHDDGLAEVLELEARREIVIYPILLGLR